MDCLGKAGSCFLRVNLSSWAAATISPSTEARRLNRGKTRRSQEWRSRKMCSYKMKKWIILLAGNQGMSNR